MQNSNVHFAVVTDCRSLPFYPIKVIGIIIGYAKVGEVISIYARLIASTRSPTETSNDNDASPIMPCHGCGYSKDNVRG